MNSDVSSAFNWAEPLMNGEGVKGPLLAPGCLLSPGCLLAPGCLLSPGCLRSFEILWRASHCSISDVSEKTQDTRSGCHTSPWFLVKGRSRKKCVPHFVQFVRVVRVSEVIQFLNSSHLLYLSVRVSEMIYKNLNRKEWSNNLKKKTKLTVLKKI